MKSTHLARRAIGISATLLGAVQTAGAASIDAAPGFFFSTLPFSDTGTSVGSVSDISTINGGIGSSYTQVSGPDVFYSFTVATAGTLTFTVTPQPGYDTAIYLLAGGSAGSNAIRASDGASFGSAEVLTSPLLQPGDYFFVVDSFYSSGSAAQPSRHQGTYSLTVAGSAALASNVPEPGMGAVGVAAGLALWQRRRRGHR